MIKKPYYVKLGELMPEIRAIVGWSQEETAKRLGHPIAGIIAIEANPEQMTKTIALALFAAVRAELKTKEKQYASLNYVLWSRNESTDREYLLSLINALAWGERPVISVLEEGLGDGPLAAKTEHLISLLKEPASADKSSMLNQHDILLILENSVKIVADDIYRILDMQSTDVDEYFNKVEGVIYYLDHLQMEFIIGDISDQPGIDILVNASDRYLSGSGGGDRAVHEAAGPELDNACLALVPVQAGQAVVTGAYWLPNKLVIHCVGPNFKLDVMAPDLLALCYRNAMNLGERLALEKGYSSIVFPSIATGTFGYPVQQAAPLALKTILEFIPSLKRLKHIRFVLYNRQTLDVFTQAWESVVG